jgi:hypothetical protein
MRSLAKLGVKHPKDAVACEAGGRDCGAHEIVSRARSSSPSLLGRVHAICRQLTQVPDLKSALVPKLRMGLDYAALFTGSMNGLIQVIRKVYLKSNNR